MAAKPSTTSNDVLPAPQNQKHKVVFESVTQEKKKLRQVVTFNAKPPVGYTFIPAGNPELTNALKEASRKNNARIYTVTTTPHANTHDLSQQVHRIGYHFSSIVVAEVCHEYGLQLSASGHVLGNSYETFLKGYRGRGAPGSEEEGWDQTTLNTKARDAIKDLFSNIPDNDLYQIIKTAFQKGKKRVGTASELPLARRAQLAVVAHIRHCYTAYDKLLRNGGYHDARGVVEKPTLAKLVEWRGDDENGAKQLEDVFREVVVISDEEDSDDDDDYDPEAPLKELSVEVVPRNVNAEIQPPKVDMQRRMSGHQGDVSLASDEDIPTSFHYVARRPKRLNDQQRVKHRGHKLDHAWNLAREQYRADPQRQIVTQFEKPHPTRQPDYSSYGSFSGQSQGSRPSEAYPNRGYPPGPEALPPSSTLQRAAPPQTIRGADGAIYTRIESPPRFTNRPLQESHFSTAPSPYDPSRPSIPVHLRPPSPPLPLRNRHPEPIDPYARESEIPLPSIERDQDIHFPSRRQSGGQMNISSRMTPPSNRLPEIVDLTRSNERPQAKKRRFDDGSNFENRYPRSAPNFSYPDADDLRDRPSKRVERVEYIDVPQSEHQLKGRNYLNDDHRVGVIDRHDVLVRQSDAREPQQHREFIHIDGRRSPPRLGPHDHIDPGFQTNSHGRFSELVPVTSGPPQHRLPQQTREYEVTVDRYNDGTLTYDRSRPPVIARAEPQKYERPEQLRNVVGPPPMNGFGYPLPPQAPGPDHDQFINRSHPQQNPEPPLSLGHRVYERIDLTRDHLPHQMENMVVDRGRPIYQGHTEPLPAQRFVDAPPTYVAQPNSRPMDIGMQQGSHGTSTRGYYPANRH